MAEVTYSAPSPPTGSDWEAIHQSNAVWEALRLKQLEGDVMQEKLKDEQLKRKLQEAIMDKMMGYGTPQQRSGQLYQPMPGGAVNQALQKGQTFSNIGAGGGGMYTRDQGGTVQQNLGGQQLPQPMAVGPSGEGGLSSTERTMMGLPAESVEEKRAFQVFLEALKESGRSRRMQEREESLGKRQHEGRVESEQLKETLHERTKSQDEKVRERFVMGELGDEDKAYLERFHPQNYAVWKLAHSILGANPQYMMEMDPEKKIKMLDETSQMLLGGQKGEAPEEITDLGVRVDDPEALTKLGNPKEATGETAKFKKSGRVFKSDGKAWYESKPESKQLGWWDKLVGRE